MKRFLSIFITLVLFSGIVFAENYDEGDDYDDGYTYELNGGGDQFLKVNIGALFPLNFGNSPRNTENPGKLYTGLIAEIGYYRFLNKYLAVGGELTATDNVSIGKKILVMVPVTFGVMFQPSVSKFEFPMYALAGLGYESWANVSTFPSLSLKGSAGVFYRINEACSVGGSSSYLWIAEFTKNDGNHYGQFLGVTLGARYHF